jgi:hypothetical protein
MAQVYKTYRDEPFNGLHTPQKKERHKACRDNQRPPVTTNFRVERVLDAFYLCTDNYFFDHTGFRLVSRNENPREKESN